MTACSSRKHEHAFTIRASCGQSQAMKNLGPGAIENVTSAYSLQSDSAFTFTWNVTFSAALGDVPELTIEPADADLSSVGADVTIRTLQVTHPLLSARQGGVSSSSVVVLSVRRFVLALRPWRRRNVARAF